MGFRNLQEKLENCYFSAGGALDARGCLDIKLTKCHFSNFCTKKFHGLTKKGRGQLWMTLGVVICKNRVQKIVFVKSGNFHSLKVKNAEIHAPRFFYAYNYSGVTAGHEEILSISMSMN